MNSKLIEIEKVTKLLVCKIFSRMFRRKARPTKPPNPYDVVSAHWEENGKGDGKMKCPACQIGYLHYYQAGKDDIYTFYGRCSTPRCLFIPRVIGV